MVWDFGHFGLDGAKVQFEIIPIPLATTTTTIGWLLVGEICGLFPKW